jgi:hypothetical protein
VRLAWCHDQADLSVVLQTVVPDNSSFADMATPALNNHAEAVYDYLNRLVLKIRDQLLPATFAWIGFIRRP